VLWLYFSTFAADSLYWRSLVEVGGHNEEGIFNINRISGDLVGMIEPSAQCLNTAIVVVLSIATGKRIEIGIDNFRGNRIANKVI